MDNLTSLERRFTALEQAANRLENKGVNDKLILAMQKEIYSLKTRVAYLEQQIYLTNYKPKQQ